MSLSIIESLVIILSIAVTVGSIFYFIFFTNKRENFVAQCYNLAPGKKKLREGLYLKNLVPYKTDIIIKTSKKYCSPVYSLKNLNMTVPEVTTEHYEIWKKKKIVKVLIQNGQATLLTPGYDLKGTVIYNPVPRDRGNHIRDDYKLQDAKLEDQKSILQTILPWAGIATVCILMVIAAHVMTKNMAEMQDDFTRSQKSAIKTMSAMQTQSINAINKQQKAALTTLERLTAYANELNLTDSATPKEKDYKLVSTIS